MTDVEFQQYQTDALSDILQELITMGPENAHKAVVDAVKSWYDYHYQEMQKWKILEETLRSSPPWTGSTAMK